MAVKKSTQKTTTKSRSKKIVTKKITSENAIDYYLKHKGELYPSFEDFQV